MVPTQKVSNFSIYIVNIQKGTKYAIHTIPTQKRLKFAFFMALLHNGKNILIIWCLPQNGIKCHFLSAYPKRAKILLLYFKFSRFLENRLSQSSADNTLKSHLKWFTLDQMWISSATRKFPTFSSTKHICHCEGPLWKSSTQFDVFPGKQWEGHKRDENSSSSS